MPVPSSDRPIILHVGGVAYLYIPSLTAGFATRTHGRSVARGGRLDYGAADFRQAYIDITSRPYRRATTAVTSPAGAALASSAPCAGPTMKWRET